ncbi:related to YRB2 - Ran-GTPase-binding protein involved in nuclear protein export [Melanopsichium pennsylvanicum]|uniref:Related to YRB2 - Ran-GTPase-binding protein involved in nuclear protein export n=2 Tax=Melanopsichium pennsylvanicum TaxID=63383 RepID=A0AAJ5C6S8_9BASI|nr:related to YRB2-Ran-GTPase-binding protein involved in nuclear protein export [Melanopsichium pennsylvanicum 4]SNX85784.1 related to YRB2 - Ran-GTPase-binding protein involved in nuclear protein export [Melanopsichium pennsylvanicum]
MSHTKSDGEHTAKVEAEQPRNPQAASSPNHESSSSHPSSPASASREVTIETTSQTTDDPTSRRKREREGSLEPSQFIPSRAADAIPAKKNRVEDSLQEEEDDADNHTDHHALETEKVGHIRKKVDELSTKELQSASSTAPIASAIQTNQQAAADEVPETHPSTPNTTNESYEAPQSNAAEQAPKTVHDPPARTQPTFSSFSSKSSPFSSVPSSSGSSASATKSSFSAFAAKSSSPVVGSGIKPSSLGSSIGGHKAKNGSASPVASSSSATATSKPIVKGSSFGFGAFAGASPLSQPKADSSAASEKESDKPEPNPAKATFEQKLLNEDKDTSAASEITFKPLFGATEAEAKTGEEDEESIHSIRAKLYTMAEDQSWKERGTGTLRVNVPKQSLDKRTARLVMRADGVLRVILNVSLFKGMKCELQEKFVRIIAFEEAKPVHYAIKLSNPNNAAALMDVLDDFVLSADDSSKA